MEEIEIVAASKKTLKIKNQDPFELKKTLRCPNCTRKFAARGETLKITFEGAVRGDYCMRCYAEWIHRHIPKLEKIDGR